MISCCKDFSLVNKTRFKKLQVVRIISCAEILLFCCFEGLATQQEHLKT